MNPLFSKNNFLVKEHIGMFKAANNYDIYDPESNSAILFCREPNLGLLTKLFRFSDYKRMTPFEIVITDTNQTKLLTIKRGTTFFRSVVEVFDENQVLLGRFRQRMLSIGGKFDVEDASGNTLCRLEGKWTGWNFSFKREGVVLATVAKKWAGIGKELFTSADNYMISIDSSVAENDPARPLIISAVMCIDMVLKE
ncbi:MAG: RNAase [Flavobacteriales bacterium]|nr:RNAase [Flavobacteriales bacterium]